MTTIPTHPGTDRASDVEDIGVAIGEVSSAYHDLGEMSIAEMASPKGHEIVTRCRDTEQALLAMYTAIAAECERMRTALQGVTSVLSHYIYQPGDRFYTEGGSSHRKVGMSEGAYGLALKISEALEPWRATPAPPAATSEEGTSDE